LSEGRNRHSNNYCNGKRSWLTWRRTTGCANLAPVAAEFRLDAGFGTYDNVALLIEMGYKVYTKAHNHRLVTFLKDQTAPCCTSATTPSPRTCQSGSGTTTERVRRQSARTAKI